MLKAAIFFTLLIAITTSSKTAFYNEPLIAQCVHNILEKYSNIKRDKILISMDVVLRYPVFKIRENVDFKAKTIFSETRFDIVIIDEKYFNITSFVLWDYRREYFNPRANYIVFTKFVSPKIFQLFGKHYINNVFVIDEDFSLFSYQPYLYESVDKPDFNPIKTGNCFNVTKKDTIFQIYIPKYWRNTTLRDCYRVLAPYTTRENDGLENQFLDIVQKALKVKRSSTEILNNFTDQTLQIFSVGQHLSIKGTQMLLNQEADVLAGYNSPNKTTPKYFDISGSFYYDAIAWVTPNAEKMSHWKRFTNIFSVKTWICFIVAILLWIFIVHAVQKDIELFQLAFVTLQILLEHSVAKYLIKNKVFLRLMLSAWMIAFLVISTLFKNSMLLILSTEKRNPQWYNMKDILASEMQMTSYINLSNLYIDYRNVKEYPINFDHIEFCSSVLRCVNRTAFRRDKITTAPKAIVRYNWIPKYYINDQGEVLVRVSRHVIKPIYIHLIFSKGYPLFSQINDILIRMTASGWFDHAYKEMRWKIKRATSGLLFEVDRIGMSRFGFVFIIWGIGLMLSTVVFGVEMIFYFKNRH